MALPIPWWRHQMESFFRVTGPLCGVKSPHKGQWRGALMFSLICAWINDWVNNREAGHFRRHRGHYDVNVMTAISVFCPCILTVIYTSLYDVLNTQNSILLWHFEPDQHIISISFIWKSSIRQSLCWIFFSICITNVKTPVRHLGQCWRIVKWNVGNKSKYIFLACMCLKMAFAICRPFCFWLTVSTRDNVLNNV